MSLIKFINLCTNEGRPELAELLPSIQSFDPGAAVSVDASGSRCARRLDCDDCCVLAAAFEASRIAVHSLVLPNHEIGDEGASALASALPRLAVLDLRGNNLGSEGCGAICEAAKGSASITALDLSWNALGKEGGYRLAEMLALNDTLLSLSIASADLDTHALVAILSVLRTNDVLQRLDLSGGKIAAEQHLDVAKHVSCALELNNRLTSLTLCNTRLGDDGAAMLAGALRANKALETLELRACAIHAGGGSALAHTLRHAAQLAKRTRQPAQPPLKRLVLDANYVGTEGGVAFANALDANCSLTELSVCKNSIDDATLEAIADALLRNTTLTRLNAWGNNFGHKANQAFHALKHDDQYACPVDFDFKTYEVDGRLRAAEN